MSLLEQTSGAHVDLISFGIAHFMLALTKGEQSFTISSSADISFDASNQEIDFRDLEAPVGLTGLVGKHLKSIEHSEDRRYGKLRFEEGQTVYANWPDAVDDNLFIIRFDGLDEWTLVG